MKRNLILTLSSSEGFGNKLANIVRRNMDGTSNILNIASIRSDGAELKMLLENPNEDLKIFLIMPEFNGSYPAYFKEWIDNQGWPNQLQNQKVFLVGYSGSFSGNVLGVNHIKAVLDYIGADTYRQAAHFTYNGNSEIHKGTTTNKEREMFLELLKKFNEL